MNHRLTLFFTLLLGLVQALPARTLCDSVSIHFRQSRINLDPSYMSNGNRLDEASQRIMRYCDPDSGTFLRLTGVEVVGGASPEGSVQFNEWLSHRRAERIFDYIGSRIDLPRSLTTFTFLGRDWQGLRCMVLADPAVPYRDEVLALLDEIIDAYRRGETEEQDNLNKIKRLRSGEPYLYMYHKLFPSLRESRLMLHYVYPTVTPKLPVPSLAGTPAPLGIPEIVDPEYTLPVLLTPCRPFYMGLKTNMLLDALAIPNIGAEFYLGRDISIVGNWMYGWWKCDHRHRYWRAYGGDLAVRYWFGAAARRKPLTGHHIGVYGSLLTYDFEWGGTGYMGGLPGGTLWDRCNWVAGVEYGYSLPVARRVNIDFTLGLGYMGGEYQVYDPRDGHYVWRETRRRRYWGPTKLEVSLVWLIGCDNYNRPKRKGGAL